MPNNKRFRGPSVEEKHELELLLKEIPTRTVVHIDWKSPEGQEFVKELRRLQVQKVSLPEIANALGVGESALSGAVTYWQRKKPARARKRQREPRPLKRDAEEQ